MIVLPFKMKHKTKGGLVLPETTIEKQQVASQVELVLSMGQQRHKHKERYPEGQSYKVNDRITNARHPGSSGYLSLS